jgi:hypothetical protein
MSRLATTASNEITANWWVVETTTSNTPPKTQGYAVEEEVNEEDGSIRLVVRKWVSE